MDEQLGELAVLAVLAFLFVVTHWVLSVRVARQRELESRLDAARAEIAALRSRLTDATRPPTQFARMHMRGAAVDRFVRLRLAAPRRSRLIAVDQVRERPH